MTITGISSVDPSSQTPTASFNDPRNSIRQLFTAIQSGDLSAAQQAYGALGALAQPDPTQTSTVGKDFDAIGQALQSGNITAAQQALSTLQQDLQAAAQTHRHHHGHHHHGGGTDSTNSTNQPGATDPNDPTSLVGTNIRVQA